MANQCRACTKELPDATTQCVFCGAAVETYAPPPVSEVPATLRPMPTPAEVQAVLARVDEPAYKIDNSLTGIGGWLILVAIQLATGPFICLYGVIVDLRVLYGARYETHLSTHHVIAALILFEAATSTIAMLALIGLNYLFYSKKRLFPKLMITYICVRAFLMLIDHAAVFEINGHTKVQPVLRYLVYAVIWIPYFINSIRVEQTFTE